MINRFLLDKIADQCFSNKVILLLGARQVGKTTMLKILVEKLKGSMQMKQMLIKN